MKMRAKMNEIQRRTPEKPKVFLCKDLENGQGGPRIKETTEMLKSGRGTFIAAPSLQKHTHSSKRKPKLCTHLIRLPSALPAPGRITSPLL